MYKGGYLVQPSFLKNLDIILNKNHIMNIGVKKKSAKSVQKSLKANTQLLIEEDNLQEPVFLFKTIH